MHNWKWSLPMFKSDWDLCVRSVEDDFKETIARYINKPKLRNKGIANHSNNLHFVLEGIGESNEYYASYYDIITKAAKTSLGK
jgi:hypothetical protein